MSGHPPQQPYDHESLERGVDEEKARPESLYDDSNKENHEAAVAPKEQQAAAPPGPGGPGPVPNGGAQAWLQVLGSWMLFFNTWGILNTFGVYQTYYESGDLFTSTSSTISWIGCIQSIMLLLCGLVAGPLYDRGYFRWLLVFGSFFVVFGHMMLSLCHTFWQCLLAQGFCVGIGAGLIFIPALAILPTYFNTRLGLAVGIAASGSSMGGIIYPIMFYRLVNEVGFGWGTRIIGFTALATLLIPLVTMKVRVKPGRVRAMVDWSAFTDVPFITFVFGTVVGFIGLYIGLFYISYFGESSGYTDASLSFYLVPILNAGSVFGRTLPNWLSDKVGPTNVIAPGAFIVGILLFRILTVHNAGGMVVIALLFGFFSGIFIALPPVIIVALTKDKSQIGTRIGMAFAIISIGVLVSGPVGGAILGNNDANLDWDDVWIYGGVCALASGFIMVVVRILRSGMVLKAKV